MMKSTRYLFTMLTSCLLAYTSVGQPQSYSLKNSETAPTWNWAMTFGGAGGFTGADLVRDQAGNLFVTGYYNGTTNFGSSEFESTGVWDLFLGKFDPAGNLIWSQTFHPAPNERLQGLRLRLDGSGQIVVAGNFSGTVSLGSSTIVSTGNTDVFVARFDGTGNPVWAKGYGTAYEESLAGLTLDAQGNAFIAVTISMEGYVAESVIKKFSVSGQMSGLLSGEFCISALVSYNNSVIATGYVRNETTIGSTTLSSLNYPAAFLMNAGQDGTINWAFTFASGDEYSDSKGYDVEVDENGHIVTTGYYSGAISFGSPSVSLESGVMPHYVARFSSDGTPEWAVSIGETWTMVTPSYIRLDNVGNPVFFGFNDWPITIGSTTIPKDCNFLVQMDTVGTILSAAPQVFRTNQSIVGGTGNLYQLSVNGINNLVLNETALSGELVWMQQSESPCGNTNTYNTIAVDRGGNTFLHGQIDGKVYAWGSTLEGQGTYLAKFSGDRTLRWMALMAARQGSASTIAVSADNLGNSFVLGDFTDTITIGTNVLVNTTPTGNQNTLYFAKFDGSGNCQWAQMFSTTTGILGVGGIVIADDGRITIACTFYGTLTIGTTSISSNGGGDIFLASFSPDGALLYLKGYGGTSAEQARSLTIDMEGNTLMTGLFSKTVDFGGNSLTSSGGYDMFVLKSDPDGGVIWVRQAGGPGTDRGHAVAADSSGNVLVYGLSYGAHLDFGNGVTLDNEYSNTFFLVKYLPDGSAVWAQSIGSPVYTWPAYQIGTDGEGSCYVAGQFSDTLVFQSGELITGGVNSLFVAKYSADGSLQWYKHIVNNSIPTILVGLQVFGKDNLVIAGKISNASLKFDQAAINSAGSSAYLALLGSGLPNPVGPGPGASTTRIYPNPAGNCLYVDPGKVSTAGLVCSLTSTDGRQVFRTTVYGPSPFRVDLPELPDGIYLFSWQSGGHQGHQNLVIQQ